MSPCSLSQEKGITLVTGEVVEVKRIRALLEGFIIGFSIAVPIGPIGVLCIRRTLTYGRRIGVASGLGAALADAVYAAIAGFGLTVIIQGILHAQEWIRLIGGLALLLIGLKIIFSIPPTVTHHETHVGYLRALLTTFFLTLTNPVAILAFTAVFAGLNVGMRNYASAPLLVLGVFLGSATWWLILCTGVSVLRERLTPTHLRWVNRISGLIILAFGLLMLFTKS